MTPIESFRAKLGAFVHSQPSLNRAALAIGMGRPAMQKLLRGESRPSKKILLRLGNKIGLTDHELDELIWLDEQRILAARKKAETTMRGGHPHDAILRNWRAINV